MSTPIQPQNTAIEKPAIDSILQARAIGTWHGRHPIGSEQPEAAVAAAFFLKEAPNPQAAQVDYLGSYLWDALKRTLWDMPLDGNARTGSGDRTHTIIAIAHALVPTSFSMDGDEMDRIIAAKIGGRFGSSYFALAEIMHLSVASQEMQYLLLHAINPTLRSTNRAVQVVEMAMRALRERIAGEKGKIYIQALQCMLQYKAAHPGDDWPPEVHTYLTAHNYLDLFMMLKRRMLTEQAAGNGASGPKHY